MSERKYISTDSGAQHTPTAEQYNRDVATTNYIDQVTGERHSDALSEYQKIDDTEFNNVSVHLLQAMRRGVDFNMKVKIRELTIELRPLSIFEQQEIEGLVLKRVSNIPESRRTVLLLDYWHKMMTILYASQTKILNSEPTISISDLKVMTKGEIDFIYDQYLIHVDKVNPHPDLLTDKDLEEWVEAIKKNPVLLSSLTYHQQRQILIHLFDTYVPPPLGNIPI